ncbi:LysR family transcriptional regulator [Paenibacillus filicis]|uniref:LysR family transcriptional regulator n=1 Tax=Paenibacillus gyeongsangnamensis TaxID=3388067 RepID=A0ABT4Q5B3_9BACL|nr:LysR family transcriptional regulator [Paenibacillus filicis]MCZ8512026.1 LysR family transcriptional regulator [Paenibacillus filicis]
MNLHALRLFYTVAQAGSVTRAAEELLISQPAVTAQIRNLEKELGLPLFETQGRGIRLSAAGDVLQAYAERLFSLEARMEQAMADYRTGTAGRLRLTATSLPAGRLLPRWMAEFKTRHPALELVLDTAGSAEAVERLLRHEADIAFIGGGSPLPSEIAQEVLFEDPFLFIVPAGHPFAGATVTMDRMLTIPFVMREQGSSAREMLFAYCRTKGMAPPRVGLEFNGMNETIRAVAAGYGAALMSTLEAVDYLMRGEVARVDVADVRFSHPIRICTLAEGPLGPAAAPFLSFVREQKPLLGANG